MAKSLSANGVADTQTRAARQTAPNANVQRSQRSAAAVHPSAVLASPTTSNARAPLRIALQNGGRLRGVSIRAILSRRRARAERITPDAAARALRLGFAGFAQLYQDFPPFIAFIMKPLAESA